jgi:arginine-tRNA-protein transferase
MSTVYFFFDLEESRRSLGTFSALIEIETARRLDLPYYYLGYWVPGCRKMEYKAALGPHELLIGQAWTAGASGPQSPQSL